MFRVEAVITIWNHDFVIMIMYLCSHIHNSIRLKVVNIRTLRTQLLQTSILTLTVILRLWFISSQLLNELSSIRLGVMYMWTQVHYHDKQIMISNRDNSLHSEQTHSHCTYCSKYKYTNWSDVVLKTYETFWRIVFD